MTNVKHCKNFTYKKKSYEFLKHQHIQNEMYMRVQMQYTVPLERRGGEGLIFDVLIPGLIKENNLNESNI